MYTNGMIYYFNYTFDENDSKKQNKNIYSMFVSPCVREYIKYKNWPPIALYRVAQKAGTFDFSGLLLWSTVIFFSPLLDRASFPHYNNTKINKFGWELFILWVISYGLSFSGFTINLSLIVPRNSGNRANPENYSPWEITHKIKSSQPNLMILVLL